MNTLKIIALTSLWAAIAAFFGFSPENPSPKPDPLTGCSIYDLDCEPISDPPSPPDVE